MKKYFLYLNIIISFNSALAQQYCIKETPTADGTTAPCCNAIINTDYNFPSNPERTDLVNQFNWLNQNGTGQSPQAFININRNNAVIPIDHPLLNDVSKYYFYSNYRIGQQVPFNNHNMHPKFGWQILHHNYGLNLFSNTPASSLPQIYNPYMIFYNKYSGKMRVFVSPGAGLTFDSSSVRVSHVLNGANLKSSGLLSSNEDLIQALDKPTSVNSITASIPFATPNSWVGTDIQTSYDPCICKNESRLKFDFVNQDLSKVYMSGNIVGINKPLDNSGNSPLQFGNNFLSSIYSQFNQGQRVKPTSGMLVYNAINNSVQSAYVSQNMKNLSSAMDAIKGIVPGIDLLGLPLGDAIKFGLSFGSKQLNPPTPNITFLEAQGAFAGEINNTSSSGSYASFEILNPGSNAEYRQQIPWPQQPFYNEALGLFALLNTPQMTYTDIDRGDPVNEYDNGAGGLGFLLKEPIQFVVNPAAEIDMQKSKFHAAIEFDLYGPSGQKMYVNNMQNIPIELKDYFAPMFKQLSTDNETTSIYNNTTLQWITVPTNKRTFSSYILPLNKIHKYTYWLKFFGGTFQRFVCGSTVNKPNFRLRIYADYVFKPNEYGVVNTTTQTYLYKIDAICQHDNYNTNQFPCNYSTNPFCGKENLKDILPSEDNLTIGYQHYTSNVTISVKNLTINGNLSTDPGVKVIIYFSESVNIISNSVISPNVEIRRNTINQYEPDKLPTEDFMKNVYCKNSYKASLLKSSSSLKEIMPNSIAKQTNTSLILHPNPAKDYVNIVLEGYQNTNASLKIYDIMGREVLDYVERDITSSRHTFPLSIASLPNGTFVVKIWNGIEEKTTKLVIVKQQ